MGDLQHKRQSGFPRFRGRWLALVSVFLMTSSASFPGLSLHAATNPFLTLRQTDSTDITAFTKWTAVMPRYESQRKSATTECYGEGCLNREWEALLKDLRTKSMDAQIEEINNFFNQIPYISDEENYGATDYWQSPYELMERGGDCEDYAIAKYISLRRLGIPEHDMRILIVRDNDLGGTIHAVLEVTLADGSHILDNQQDEVVMADRVENYQPVFAINETRWWAFNK